MKAELDHMDALIPPENKALMNSKLQPVQKLEDKMFSWMC